MRSEKVLDGTGALVTGASSGIGAATAIALARSGARVALVARRADRLDALGSEIRDGGGTALAIPTDVTEPRQAAEAVERTVAEFGRLDTVINSAGIMLLGPALESKRDEWERMVALNVLGSLYVTHAALKHLVSAAQHSPRGVADLITISSTAGRVARPGGAVYALTKFGMAAFSESLRQELIPHRVRVSVIEPGTVDTELVSHVRDDIRQAAQRQVESIVPLRPEDIAETILHVVTRDRRVAVNEISSGPPNRAGEMSPQRSIQLAVGPTAILEYRGLQAGRSGTLAPLGECGAVTSTGRPGRIASALHCS